jgi:glycosyltransferase involved in cell wall biosynthesis
MLVFPSRSENSPNAVKEAVVAGVPVVAAAVGSVAEYVLTGKNGVLAKPGSSESLTEGIMRLLGDPTLARGEVCSQTLGRLREQLSPERMARSFLGAYERTLSLKDPTTMAESGNPSG